MKRIFSIIAISLLLASCGGGNNSSVDDVISEGNLDAIRAKRSEVIAEQEAITEKIKQLDAAIAELDNTTKLPLITTFAAKSSEFKHYLEIQGNIDTKQNLVIYPEYSGVLTSVLVKEGQKVRKGQLLARIDDGGLGQQVSQMQIQADLAKTTYERQKRLWDQKIGSEIQYLQAKSNYEAQEKAVNQMKSQLSRTLVKAPFSGIIDNVISEQGTVVAPGQSQLMRIVNLKDMYIEADVPESYISNVTEGKEVLVDFPVLGKTVPSTIRQASNYIDPNNRSYKVEIAVPNKEGEIKPNLTAKLKINDYTNPKAILIPQSIISENSAGEQYVFIVEGKDAKNMATAKKVIIQTGKTQGDLVEITEGLQDGNDIIEEGARSVKDGQKVEILNMESNEQ